MSEGRTVSEKKPAIDLYTWNTPNGRKVSIMLEELGLSYRVLPIDIGRGEQYEEDFLRISPNNKIPAIVDHDTGTSLMESGAILMYLAHKTGKLMSETGSSDYWQELEWLMLQMGGIGPMFGQSHHFLKFNPGKSEYSEQRYGDETLRLYGVLDRRLQDRQFICAHYSVADIATWPWVSRYEWQRVDLNDFPNVKRWYVDIASRPAVQRGYGVPDPLAIPLP